jgi:hypothetical protein
VALFIEAGDDRTRNELQTTGETEQVPKLGRRTERDRQEVDIVPCGSDVRNLDDILRGPRRQRAEL